MAKEQIAQCMKVREVKVGQGEVKQIYVLQLDGKDFEVWERDDFKAKVGEKFRPFVVIVDSPYVSRKNPGRAYNRHIAMVNWERA